MCDRTVVSLAASSKALWFLKRAWFKRDLLRIWGIQWMDLLLCPASLEWVEYYRLQLRQENRRMHQRFYLFIYYFIFYFSPCFGWENNVEKVFQEVVLFLFFFFKWLERDWLDWFPPPLSYTHSGNGSVPKVHEKRVLFCIIVRHIFFFFCNLKENCKTKKFQQLKNKKIVQKIAYGSVRLFIVII